MKLKRAQPVENYCTVKPKPILKWVGGKTQLLPELRQRMPKSYGKYIEPFFGGGALFFDQLPKNAVISDSNPELINLYRAIAQNPESVISELKSHVNSKDHYYNVRALRWEELDPFAAAARTIFLNRTGFNGLYRVNKKGQFNVPFGNYAKPKIIDEQNIHAASHVLAKATIIEGDYLKVLQSQAAPGDFVFLDPPYLPISDYSDFKRYTKEQFYEEDHRALAKEVERLHELGCYVILTNSNHPLVHDLFQGYQIDVIPTRRNISASGSSRRGEDVIVTIPPRKRLNLRLLNPPIDEQTQKFPTTRYMGSKSKLLPEILSITEQFDFSTFVDLFSGSGIVGYMQKAQGKRVISNDYMAFSANIAEALIENSSRILSPQKAEALVSASHPNSRFVSETFEGLYFSDADNAQIDNLRAGISKIRNRKERAIALAALVRACLKKRPRGIFTYVGNRYNDGRKDLQLSINEHFLDAVSQINAAVFDNGQASLARRGDAMTVAAYPESLVYIDPPYYSPLSDNEYVRRYHFVEGLVLDWQGVQIQENTRTKKFKNYPTPFSSRVGAKEAFDRLFKRHRNSIILVSYSSNALPAMDEMLSLLSKYKSHVDVKPIKYRYSFSTKTPNSSAPRNEVLEYLFIGY
jgi:DNA adenine methylase